MSTVRLKNGLEELDVVVAAVMMSLRGLWKDHPLAIYELRELCRNRDHRIFGALHVPLVQLALVNNARAGGGFAVHDSVRNVVVSAVTGEWPDMTLGDPVAERRPNPTGGTEATP